MEKVLIFGHKKPDTDAVCGAIALSYLKNKMGLNTEPRILSEINSETAFALKKFDVPVPRYLNDVKVQLKDVKYKKNFYVNENSSIYSVYNYLTKKEITGIPIVGDKKEFIGYVSLKEITKELIVSDTGIINTSFANIAEALNASKIYQYDEFIAGKPLIVAIPYRLFINTVTLDSESIVIASNHEQIIEHAINSKVKLIIAVNNMVLTKAEIALAKKNKVNIIITPYDTFKVARVLSLANPIKTIQRITAAICFEPIDYLTDFLEIRNRHKHTNYPIVNGKGICEGMLRVTDTGEVNRKKVILVDHNGPEQSVDGLSEADIIEIVDHHNIGPINSFTPINFRNMAVGSVNTIIYYLYLEHDIKIPKAIAGLMLSGLLSDTLILASPTTTELDRSVAKALAKLAGVDIKAYGLELLRSGVSIEGLSPIDVINKDFKNYAVGEYKLGVAQVFTTSFNEYQDKMSEYIEKLNEISINNNYKVVCLFITDIINNNSYILFNESAKRYLEDAYNIDDLSQGHILKGIVSRKKQMVPLIMEILEKI